MKMAIAFLALSFSVQSFAQPAKVIATCKDLIVRGDKNLTMPIADSSLTIFDDNTSMAKVEGKKVSYVVEKLDLNVGDYKANLLRYLNEYGNGVAVPSKQIAEMNAWLLKAKGEQTAYIEIKTTKGNTKKFWTHLLAVMTCD